MKWSMTFDGGDELARAFDGLSTRLTKKIVSGALLESGEPMRSSASRFAPYEPGPPDLRENIGMNTVRNREAGDIATVAIGPTRGFAYGLPQEIGTMYHAAHPFMRPAFDTEGSRVLGKLGQALWRELASRGIGRSVSLPTTVQSGGRLL